MTRIIKPEQFVDPEPINIDWIKGKINEFIAKGKLSFTIDMVDKCINSEVIREVEKSLIEAGWVVERCYHEYEDGMFGYDCIQIILEPPKKNDKDTDKSDCCCCYERNRYGECYSGQ